ncbi:MAG: diguanylate cyclase [Pseudomonadota bacterium]
MLASAPFSQLFRRICAVLCLLALACSALATPTSPLRFKRLGSLDADELSILSLLQDRQGFIWIGTHSGGLYRYNGYQAVKYEHDPQKLRSLPNDRVSALYEDPKGRIWAGTQNGLARYNPDTNDFTGFRPPPGPSSQLIVKAIIGDGRGGIWLATWGGLQHFDPDSGRFSRYMHDKANPASLASNDLNALALDDKGGLYAATWPGGLDYLAPGATDFVHRRVDTDGASDDKLNIVRSLYFGADHTLWMGTETGVVTWNSDTSWDTRTPLPSPATRINSLYGDSHGAVWAGSLAAGLLRWDRGERQPVRYVHRANDPHSLPSDHIRAVMEDRGGMLWIASFTDGISLVNLNSQGFQRFIPFDAAPDNTLPNNSVQNLAGAPGKRLWLGGNTGFSLFDPDNGEVLKTYRGVPRQPGALSNDIVYSLYQQPEGPLWIGTAGGLNRLERPDAPFSVVHFGSVASDFINTITPSANGKLWLGTGLQLVLYDPASGQRHDFPADPADGNSRSVNGTTCIVEDGAGRVWLGSEWNGGGLDLLEKPGAPFRHFLHDPADPDSLSDDNVSSIYLDPKGRVWAGTAKGVNLVESGAGGSIRFRHYGAPDSVGSVKILSMRSDATGMLWLSTAAGLLRLDPDNGKVTRFRPSDGLSEGFAPAAAYAAPDGALYFGGVKGMTAVHPQAVRSVSMAPQVAITDISVFNRSLSGASRPEGVRLAGTVTAPQALTLSANESVFSLEFAALHYTDPGSNRYAYRLVGFDRDWVQADAVHRSATYTNLDPGNYRFEVKAANEQGLWSERPTTLTITILPPFWKRWWFRALVGLFLFALLAALYRARVRRLTRSQVHLKAMIAERTSELEDSNARLAALSNTDGLTGVTNRRGFDEALEREWRRANRNGYSLALAMLDVDHFKNYNDLYGHQAGDQCLRTVANLIAEHGRRTTDMVARYGGEEFALLAPATDSLQVLVIAQGICEQLQRLAIPHAGSPHGVITISIGVAALTPEQGITSENLVHCADRALYRAKQEGRNRAVLFEAAALADG